jgi:hypothetical protein
MIHIRIHIIVVNVSLVQTVIEYPTLEATEDCTCCIIEFAKPFKQYAKNAVHEGRRLVRDDIMIRYSFLGHWDRVWILMLQLFTRFSLR